MNDGPKVKSKQLLIRLIYVCIRLYSFTNIKPSIESIRLERIYFDTNKLHSAEYRTFKSSCFKLKFVSFGRVEVNSRKIIIDIFDLSTNKMDWRIATDPLYKNISPKTGTISHFINNDIIHRKYIDSISIEFDVDEFIYTDPFYGEIKSTNNFKMNIQFDGNFKDFKISSIGDLENKHLDFCETFPIGSFSNSIHFTVMNCRFGSIKSGRIMISFHYVLTNSDGYAMMDGTYEEHSSKRGIIEATLTFNPVRIHTHRNNNKLNEIIKELNPSHYDLPNCNEKIYEGSNQDYQYYYIPVKIKS